MTIKAIWSNLWNRGVSISFEFSAGDGGNDKCQKAGCGKPRKLHRRDGDHKFVEKEK